MFKNDKYRSKLTRYSTNMDITFGVQKGNFIRKAVFFYHSEPKNTIFDRFVSFLASFVIFHYFLSPQADFWVSEGQNQVNVKSKIA